MVSKRASFSQHTAEGKDNKREVQGGTDEVLAFSQKR